MFFYRKYNSKKAICTISHVEHDVVGHFSSLEHPSQPIAWWPAVSDALAVLLCEDIFGLKAPERLISADRDGAEQKALGPVSAPTDLPGRCWPWR